MAGSIHISPDEMREKATEFNNCGNEISEVLERMTELTDELSNIWEGESSEAFYEQFQQLKPGFRDAIQLTEDIADQLRSIADIYEQTDDEIARRLG